MSLLGKALGIASGASPWLLLGIFVGGVALGTTGCWYVQEQRYDRASAERDNATSQMTMATADARRWEGFANTANAANDRHNAEAEKARADLAQATAILTTADQVARSEAAELNAEIAKWKERARANPDQTRPLGPIARDAYCYIMRERAGQIPTGCPATH